MDGRDGALAAALERAAVTRHACVQSRALDLLPDLLREIAGGRTCLVIADDNTQRAAGARVEAILAASGIRAAPAFVLPGRNRLKPQVETASTIAAEIAASDALPVAVGSGVINDLVKLAAHRAGTSYVAVATAASMDGYAASGAALIDGRFKRTLDCPPPVAVVADLDVIAAAPPAMVGWGFGDLAGKVIAGADWILADALAEEAIAPDVFDMVQKPLSGWLTGAWVVARGEPMALEGLMHGLLVTGFAMQAYGNSRPASGSDHLFAHLWEMEGLSQESLPVAHGACVAVGCLTMLRLYDWLLAQDPTTVDIDARVAATPPLSALQAEVARSFREPEIARNAWEETRRKHASPTAVRTRLETLHTIWPELQARLETSLPPLDQLQAQLAAAGAPATAAAIGVDPQRLAVDIKRARLIRRRFTVLDLLADLGWLDRAIAATLPAASRSAA